jgi:general secretion pathway protein D
MVFLHPVIVRDATSGNIISGDKYSYMRTKQLEQQAQGLPLVLEPEIPILPNLDDFLTVLPGDNLTPIEIKPQLDKNNP